MSGLDTMNAAVAAGNIRKIVGPTILLGDGSYFDYVSCDASEMTLGDYIWGLATKARFSGQTRYRADVGDECSLGPRCMYVVAQHCVLMAQQMLDDGHSPEAAFEGLMHESDEVVWPDFPSPAKSLLPPEVRQMVKQAGAAIDQRFQVTRNHTALVKQYDLRMLATERRELMPQGGDDRWPVLDGYEPFPWRIACWTPEQAERRFSFLYIALRGMIDA